MSNRIVRTFDFKSTCDKHLFVQNESDGASQATDGTVVGGEVHVGVTDEFGVTAIGQGRVICAGVALVYSGEAIPAGTGALTPGADGKAYIAASGDFCRAVPADSYAVATGADQLIEVILTPGHQEVA